ncbi:hypothetical protein LCGC14_2333650 [marine sediment metagenome]|uniref:Uncharacterized protein n=1 Tax=marine sediment metagenome TaxID=412755 RepID=A0A0F9CDZ5_9ZZZZ
MTDRINALTVVLDHDYRDDDIESMILAIMQFRGVLAVKANVAETDEDSELFLEYKALKGAVVGLIHCDSSGCNTRLQMAIDDLQALITHCLR